VAQPRYAPADRLLTLVLALQSSRVGLSMAELKELLDVERRTVERLLASLRGRGDLDLRREDDRGGTKVWRILGNTRPLALDVTADELAALHVAIRQVTHASTRIHAGALRSLAAKLGVAMQGPSAAVLENNAMDLAAAEGLVVRPGPREHIDPKVLSDLRRAVLTSHKVRLEDYRYRGSGKTGYVTVRPYGFQHGTRSYLIAHSENEKAGAVRRFALANVQAVTLLDETFGKPRGWSLEKFARQSFGVRVEKPVNVEWRFSPRVADEASRWVFHPTQKTHLARDGSLVLRFRAGGLREMAWHLVTWGEDVEVVKPSRLRDELAQLSAVAARLSRGPSRGA